MINLIGWLGVIGVISAYFLVSFSVIKPDGLIYQALNAIGALCLCVVSYHKMAYQPALSNLIWALIAIAAIIKVLPWSRQK